MKNGKILLDTNIIISFLNGNVEYKNIENILSLEGVTPHIYGKKQTRPFRKMGHVTIVNQDLNKAHKIAEIVKNTIKVISK